MGCHSIFEQDWGIQASKIEMLNLWQGDMGDDHWPSAYVKLGNLSMKVMIGF